MSAERTLPRAVRGGLISEVKDRAGQYEDDFVSSGTSLTPEFVAIYETAKTRETVNVREAVHLRRMAAAYIEMVARVSIKPKSEARFWLQAITYVSDDRKVIREAAEDLRDLPRPYKAAVTDMLEALPDLHEAA